jgi:hypothetical protein
MYSIACAVIGDAKLRSLRHEHPRRKNLSEKDTIIKNLTFNNICATFHYGILFALAV